MTADLAAANHLTTSVIGSPSPEFARLQPLGGSPERFFTSAFSSGRCRRQERSRFISLEVRCVRHPTRLVNRRLISPRSVHVSCRSAIGPQIRKCVIVHANSSMNGSQSQDVVDGVAAGGLESDGVEERSQTLVHVTANGLVGQNGNQQVLHRGWAGEETTSNWNCMSPLWETSEEAAMGSGEVASLLTPAWRVLLLSDGSVTRHLQLLTGIRMVVDCREMHTIGQSLGGLPPGAALIPGPRLQRQVYLRTPGGQALVYAASWWAAGEVGDYLRQVGEPIWVNLSQQRTELYRDVQRLYLGHSPALQESFGAEGPFWGRHYVFYHAGRPLTLIYEVFSPALQEYLGPASPTLL